MTIKEFEYYSLQYLNQWLDHDSECHKILNGKSLGKKLKAVKRAAAYYKVARSISLVDGSEEINPYKPIVDRLDGIAKRELNKDIVGQTERIVGELYPFYKKRILSAVTKLLWLKFRSPVYMYDSRAFNALKSRTVKHHDLKSFRAAWEESYKEHEVAIRKACANLGRVHLYSCNSAVATKEYLANLRQDWFYHRVHDLYLLNYQEREG